MLPVLTPQEMRAVDEGAAEPTHVLIGRAAAAVALHAVDLLGGSYGRRVVVVAGKGTTATTAARPPGGCGAGVCG
jgi:NAD(P)H-hydrate epimerase